MVEAAVESGMERTYSGLQGRWIIIILQRVAESSPKLKYTEVHSYTFSTF